jgi:methionine-rich copper-binding protein CopC
MMNRRGASLLKDVVRAVYMTGIAIVLVLATRFASAHAVLLHSTPSVNATVQGPELEVALRFNSRVDGARSTLLLASPAGDSKDLVLEKQSSPNSISAHATKLTPGKYLLRWQALAMDGHITRGEIPFQVE